MHHKRGTTRHHPIWLGLGAGGPIFMAYLMIYLLVSIGDAVMSYSAPVFIEQHVNSTLLMGLVLGFSSFVGILCDLLFAQWFGGKSFKFFFFWTLILAFVFPTVIVFLPPFIAFFLLAMAAWGIYYELMHFSHFHFINSVIARDNHALAWGLLESIRAAAYLVGPLLAVLLIDRHVDGPFLGAIGFVSAALMGFLIFLKANRSRFAHAPAQQERRSLVKEFRIWTSFMRRIWPLFLFLVTLGFVDATFWSVGTVLSEELRQTSFIGGLLLAAYTLPSLFVASLASVAARPFGKKRAALLAAMVSGAFLFFVGFSQSPLLVVALVLLFSLFFSLTFPEVYATFEDYVARLKEHGNDMIGLQGAAVSFSYIIGPILAGATASVFGNRGSFTLAGGLLIAVSLLCLLVIPRKIPMPQSDLEQLDGVA